MCAKKRFPKSVYDYGNEPDQRFSFANERTFLAWIRTSLALIGAGIALETFTLSISPHFRLSSSLILILTGLFCPINAWLTWKKNEKALRMGTPLASPNFSLPIATVVTLVGILLFIGIAYG